MLAAVPDPAAPRRTGSGPPPADIESAILEVVAGADPACGRTRVVEILRGGRSRKLLEHSYDGLPAYGCYDHLTAAEVLERVDALIAPGRVRSTGGAYPKLVLAQAHEGRGPRLGAGTNLQALLDTVHGREVQIVAVASDVPDAAALARAEAAGVPTRVFPRAEYADRSARDAAIADWLAERGAELVVLAGYMQLLSPGFLARFPDRVVNVHPSLLPAFPGAAPIEDTVAYGTRVSGVTVHLVDEGVDTGAILLQEAVSLGDAADRDAVHALLRPVEHRLLAEAVRLLARGAVRRDAANPRRLLVDR